MLAKLIVWAPSRAEALERMRRALDEFVVLGTTTNIRFLRELCDNRDVVSGRTNTTLIERVWPDGWNPNYSESSSDAALMIAAVSETAGLHRTQVQEVASNDGPVSPFQSLNRRYP